MTALPLLRTRTEPTWQHARPEDYRAFVHSYTDKPFARWELLRHYRQFVARYPDLQSWFAAPLPVRVGRMLGETTPGSDLVSYRARPYLIYLAFRGQIRFDWPWLLAIGKIRFNDVDLIGLTREIEDLVQTATALGYRATDVRYELRWAVSRLLLHRGSPLVRELTDADLAAAVEAIYAFGDRSDVATFVESAEEYRRRIQHQYSWCLHVLHVVLYHRGQVATPPRRVARLRPPRPSLNPPLEAVVQRYLGACRTTREPVTIKGLAVTLGHFIAWLTETHREITAWPMVRREHVLAYAEVLVTRVSPQTGQPLNVVTRRGYLSRLSVFFADVSTWGWADGPTRPLLVNGDLPRRPQRVPRFIPDDELERLMGAIRGLPCPYQRAALLVARWSGARREEIGRLAIDCLDHYPDGTARLRIPAGKTKRERIIPLNDEAAAAIRALQGERPAERGFPDRLTGKETRCLFVRNGTRLSVEYLFVWALRAACAQAGLVSATGKPTVSAHRFRHTVGKQLAEKGAKLATIMTVLGHSSPQMTLTYARISDPTVREDYLAVLGPGATIAGPSAAAVRTGELSRDAIDWLKTNFFKTALELGHCLRLPQEGPCECDLALTCARFVTTPQYVPRLRQRRQLELQLITDATARGWEREVQRHRCTVERIDHLLAELGEAVDESATKG